ncbi:uncharacterized protein [Ptychodera flava]|uniref:uncharacterized protein isoform X2 n=1 Tax=Ptychodera flava TaxID=63121 RepID=UPI00396A9F95
MPSLLKVPPCWLWTWRKDECPLSVILGKLFYLFRLVRKGELIERQHFKRSHDSIGEDTRKWVRFYDFNPNSIAVDVSYFDPYMEVEYTGTSGSVFAFCLRVVSFKNDKCTALKDNSLLVEGDDHHLHETKLKSTDEMKHHLREMCPNIPSHVIAKALAFWEKKIKPRLELDQGGLSAVDIEEIV